MVIGGIGRVFRWFADRSRNGVLQAIVNGSNNAQISRSLNISLETVKSHVKNILQKLQARDRTQAVVIALRAALVSLPG